MRKQRLGLIVELIVLSFILTTIATSCVLISNARKAKTERIMSPIIYIYGSIEYARTLSAAIDSFSCQDLVDDQSRRFKVRLSNQKMPKNRFITSNNKIRRMAYKQPLINRNETTEQE